MIKGVVFALGACCIWGLIFVVPGYMQGFSSVEVAMGRYIFYGAISSLILINAKIQGKCRYPLSIWMRALFFSLAATFGYYIFVIYALRYASPAICTLILGISPISIAFYGNWKEKECSYKKLVIPATLIFIGLIIINAPHFFDDATPSRFAIGLVCSFAALINWTWYVVANSRFLKHNPTVAFSDWATLIGFTSLFWVLVFGIVFTARFDLAKYSFSNPDFAQFLIGSAILGLICSWVGAFLWNKASFNLPVSLAGQLTIFETIFGLFFVYLVEQRIPPLWEGIGIAVLLGAIIYGLKATSPPSKSLI